MTTPNIDPKAVGATRAPVSGELAQLENRVIRNFAIQKTTGFLYTALMNAYGYVRISTEEQAQKGISLSVQRHKIKACA